MSGGGNGWGIDLVSSTICEQCGGELPYLEGTVARRKGRAGYGIDLSN